VTAPTFDFDRTIRPSSLTTWLDCERRWAARHMGPLVTAMGYDLSPPRPAHVGAAVGSGVHAAAAWSLKRKLETGTDDIGSDADAVEAAIVEFDARVSKEGVTWDGTTENRPTAQRQIARMTRAWRRDVAPEVRPLIVEERVEADVGDGWTVSGQLDTLTASPGRLRDTKTGTRRRANGVQYGTYGMLFDAHGYEVRSIAEDYVARVRVDREQPPVETHLIDLEAARTDAWEAIEAIQATTAEFVRRARDPHGRPAHAAFKANPASDLCSDRWCPAWGTAFCRAHKT
jgi:hypothetical protein